MQQIVYLINCKDMKQRLLSLCLALTAMTLGAKAQSGSVLINETNFPDATFRNFVATYDTDKDKNLSKAELNKVFEIDVAGKGITNLTGIEHFTNLTRLYCNDNSLSSLNISNNQYLEILNCSNNELTALDVSSNKYLYSLGCFGNHISGTAMDKLISSLSLSLSEIGQWGRLVVCSDESAHDNTITTAQIKTIMDKDWEVWQQEEGGSQVTAMLVQIDELNFPDANFRAIVAGWKIDTDGDTYLSIAERKAVTTLMLSNKNISRLSGIGYFRDLVFLICKMNNLNSLDITANKKLTYLDCSGNSLTSLDVSKNTALTQLNCSGNSLTSLDVSKNTALTELYCYDNSLKSLDVSKNTELNWLSCFGNQINGAAMTSLVNSLRSLPSETIAPFYVCSDNAETDNFIYASQVNIATGKGWKVRKLNSKGSGVDYAGVMDPVAINETNFPDETFRNYLLAQDYGKDGILTESEIKGVNGLNVSSDRGIHDLTGIAYFKPLTQLFCGGNSLISLDVSANTAMKFMDCSYCSLTSLDVSKNTALTFLGCNENNLTSLDVSQNTALMRLDCPGNQISGVAMTNLVNSLPTRSTSNYGELLVCADYVSTDNIITSAQVKIATGKGWKVMKFDSEVNAVDYAGLGDVNGDNKIDQTDLDTIVKIIMGQVNLGFAGDLNMDGKTDAADIVLMVRILKSLGK